MPTPLDTFLARREELRRGRQHHTPFELPAEYRLLTQHLRGSWGSCGEDHARGVAAGFGRDLGWDPADLMRGAAALRRG